MTLREAAQQALAALELDAYGEPPRHERNAAIAALRAALVEPVQPVAWMCPDDPERETAFNWKAGHCENCGKQRIPLYTAPPQRKPLTDDQIVDIWAGVSIGYDDQINIIELARAIEAAHGIGDSNE